MSIDHVEMNKRLDTNENSIQQIAEIIEVFDDEFKDLKATDDLIKEDLVRKSYVTVLASKH